MPQLIAARTRNGVVALLLTLAGCGGEGRPQGQPAVAAVAAPEAAKTDAAPTGLAAMVAARKLIRTAQISLQVESWDAAVAQVTSIAEATSGYVADSRQSGGQTETRRGTITVRVPAERFGAALVSLRALGKVESETVSAQDVTKAYMDLETRLRVKRETAERMRQILKDRTASLADVLAVERELARLTDESEQMEGERRFYDQQIALSTLTLTLHEPEPLTRSGLFGELERALRDSLRVMSRSLAALVYIVAFLLPWVVAALAFWKLAALARRRTRSKPPAA